MPKRGLMQDAPNVLVETEDEATATEAIDEAVTAPSLPTEFPAPAAIPGDDGWYGDADWIRVECDWPQLAPRDGFQPIWAEIDASLTIREALAIPIQPGVPIMSLIRHLAPRVRAWNVRAWNAESGEMAPVKPPSEIGMEAFYQCRPVVVEWLGWTLRDYSLNGGPNRKNETSASDPGSDGLNDVA